MRIAEICPTCATYVNAVCVVYDGDYLTNLDVSPLDTLDVILGKINNSLVQPSGAGAPTSAPTYIGQLYVNTSGPALYYAIGTTSPSDWVLV